MEREAIEAGVRSVEAELVKEDHTYDGLRAWEGWDRGTRFRFVKLQYPLWPGWYIYHLTVHPKDPTKQDRLEAEFREVLGKANSVGIADDYRCVGWIKEEGQMAQD